MRSWVKPAMVKPAKIEPRIKPLVMLTVFAAEDMRAAISLVKAWTANA